MVEDMKLIRQLENKIDSPLKQGEFDELIESKQNGYSMDEQGVITGLCLFNVSLDSLADSVLPFKELRQMVLSYVNLKAGDFSLLQQMTSLTLLDLSHNKIDDISFLGQLTNITQLYLGHNRIADLSPLENLAHLSALDLQNNLVTEIGSIEMLYSLKIVNLGDNEVSDISPLWGLKGIVYLNIAGNTVSDISPLQDLRVLANLDAARNQIDNISILSKFPGMNYLNLSDNDITDISSIRRLTGLTVLKLANNNIHGIYSLTQLRNLTDLDLEENKISDLTALRGLTDLVKLELGNNQIMELTPLSDMVNMKQIGLGNNQITDLMPLRVLTELTELYLYGNQISNLSPLSEMTNMTRLYLGGNQITELTPLSAMMKLTELYLGGNQIMELTPLSALTKLIELDLSENQITTITPLNAITNLKRLRLYRNQITDLTPLSVLKNLQMLILFANEITDITPLRALKNLNNLDLSENQITDLTPLAALTKLTTLILSNNQITDLTPLAPLIKLTEFDLRKNQIRQLPSDITSWWPDMEMEWSEYYTDGLNLYDNPLTDPPIEIVEQGKAAIQAYFDSLKGETLQLNEVKLLLVGDGGAGKTSLAKRLMGKQFDNNEPQTHGINIDLWEVKQQKTSIKIHLWDFGGQEIMHATHQFFLSKRSLYILVLDGRKDDKTEYWLKHIRSFGGDSPVLVVLNKIDQNPGFELNRRFLQEKYPNIKDFFRLSCAENTGIDDFKKALEKAISDVAIIRTTWAKSWFQVKQALENMTELYISLEQYNSLCHKENITDPVGRATLVDFLHDLGVILHFDDLGLGDVHVLEPCWATEAVYKIINSPVAAANKGILKPAFLADILKQKKSGEHYYPPDKHHYIVELMKKFEICYQLSTGDILIPDLLAVEESRFEFDYDGSLRFIFKYDFLPRSVMPRFIVRMHNDIKDNCRWRTGMLLENKAFNSTAVVKADNEEKKIFIFVNGQQKRDYFSVIRYTIRDINADFKNINVVELVPLPEAKEITVEYSELTGLEQMGIEFMPIGKLGKKIPVKLLLNGYEKEEDRLMQDNRDRSINISGNVGTLNLVQHEGDHSPVSISNTMPLDEKIGEIIELLIEHNVPGKDEIIRQLQDERVKRDKGKLREVFGRVLSVTGDIGSVYSAVAALLPQL